MALCLTKSAVEAQIDQSRGAVELITNLCGVGGAVDNSIKRQIDTLEKREEAFLKMFKCHNFQELNQKLKQIREADILIDNLSGEALSRTFLNATRKYMYQTGMLGEEEAKLEKLKQTFISNVVHDVNKASNDAKIKAGQTVQQIVFSLLHNMGSGVSLRSSSGLRGSITYNGSNLEEVLEQIVIGEITPVARARVEQFNKKYEKTFTLKTGNPLVIQDNLGAITMGLTEKQAKDQTVLPEATFQRIQDEVIDYIIARGPKDPEFVSTVKEIITKADRHIFFGRNLINGYTGLLGEIQAIYYFKKLGIMANRNMDSKIAWTGGSREDGWEPPQDLQLFYGKRKLGVQVKNTAKEFTEGINFSDKMVSNMNFSSLGIPGLDKNISSKLEPIFEMYKFNITVRKNQETKKWEPGDNPTFSGARSDIESLYEEAIYAMSLLAASIMKMAVGRTTAEGNVAYLIAGQKFVSASETLTQILGEINSKKFERFQMSAHFSKKGAGNGTIADFYNAHNSNALPKSVKLRSSYQFI